MNRLASGTLYTEALLIIASLTTVLTGNSESTNRSYSNDTKKNSSRKSTYDSYDDGYDDIYMDGDYDYDRYESDSDYADGVDDAMDEMGEDW